MKEEEIRKRMIGISIFIILFFTIGIGTMMKLGFGRIFWPLLITLFCIITFFSIIIGIVGYKFHKTNPKASKKINNPQVKKYLHSYNIYIGIIAIATSIYFYISNQKTGEYIWISIGIFIFGVLTIIFGAWNLYRIKKGKTHI
jgi:hypothetical protein